MENSLLPGDRLWVDKWSFRWGNRNPKYRDVLVFELPEIAQTQSGVTEIAIARCIGLPGDTIKSTGNKSQQDYYSKKIPIIQTAI